MGGAWNSIPSGDGRWGVLAWSSAAWLFIVPTGGGGGGWIQRYYLRHAEGAWSPALGRWTLGNQDPKKLSASQVAINGGEGWDTESSWNFLMRDGLLLLYVSCHRPHLECRLLTVNTPGFCSALWLKSSQSGQTLTCLSLSFPVCKMDI